jgi:diguanylate cyclase
VPAFATELQRAQTHDYPLVLSLISAEAFRKFVDVYGIDEAHSLLADVVGIVRKNVRDMDLLARYGADVFILCLSGMTEDESRTALEAIVRDVERNVFGKADFPVTVAIGAIQLADTTDQKRSLQDILAALGRNLMDAPTKGRNRILMTPLPKQS